MINSPNKINCRIVIRAILALIKQSLTKGGDALDIYMVESAEEIPTPQRWNLLKRSSCKKWIWNIFNGNSSSNLSCPLKKSLGLYAFVKTQICLDKSVSLHTHPNVFKHRHVYIYIYIYIYNILKFKHITWIYIYNRRRRFPPFKYELH